MENGSAHLSPSKQTHHKQLALYANEHCQDEEWVLLNPNVAG